MEREVRPVRGGLSSLDKLKVGVTGPLTTVYTGVRNALALI